MHGDVHDGDASDVQSDVVSDGVGAGAPPHEWDDVPEAQKQTLEYRMKGHHQDDYIEWICASRHYGVK